MKILFLLFMTFGFSLNAFAWQSTKLEGTLSSADIRSATLKSTDGKTVYTIDMAKLNDKESARLMGSVGKKVEVYLDTSQFRSAPVK